MEVTVSGIAVILSMVTSVVLGFLWYGPLFGKQWMTLTGIKMPEGKPDPRVMVKPVIFSLIGACLMSYVLTHVIAFGNAFMGSDTLESALTGALWCFLGFVVPVLLNTVWEGRSLKLIALYAGYWFVFIMIMGALIYFL